MSRRGAEPAGYSDRHRSRIEQLDELIETSAPFHPLYSKDLAEQIGVSIRTLQTAVLEIRGMKLHSYVRRKRLLLARLKLQQGAVSVKSAALESGFWHLSDFARGYQEMFGELPSSTLQSTRLRESN